VINCVDTKKLNESDDSSTGGGSKSEKPSGYWTISVTDNCSGDDTITLVIMHSNATESFAGPFNSKITNIKYKEVKKTNKVSQKTGDGKKLDWKLSGLGEMQVNATDAVGNMQIVSCPS